ncbi:MAG: divalent-cation tolerance protein CutA [Acidobacteriota bacterium]|nr:divalent-cation tolerance protein CutA [Acidobacteriota bacterium]
MTNKIVIVTSCSSAEEAETLAKRLLEAHLAACVNVLSQNRSYYRWKGKIEQSEEWILLVKTSRSLFGEVRALLESAHSYELPEVLALAIVDGSPNYLAWLDAELAHPDKEMPVA